MNRRMAMLLGTAISFVLTPICGKLAHRLGLESKLRPDRWGRHPTPLLGGIAVLSGALAPSVISSRESFPLLCGSMITFLLGMRDDRSDMGPREKIQGVAVAFVVERFLSALLDHSSSHRRSLSYQLFYESVGLATCVAGANSFNMADNMDGLAATLSAISSASLLTMAEDNAPKARDERNEDHRSIVSAGLMGSSLGFLAWNAYPAQVFMGDAGSLPVGYLLSRLAFYKVFSDGKGDDSGIVTRMSQMFLLMAVPATDSLFLIGRRFLEHRPIARGGTDHISHSLARFGLSEPIPVLMLQAGQTIAGFAALRMNKPGVQKSPGQILFACAAVIGVVVVRFMAGRHDVSPERTASTKLSTSIME